MIPDHLKYAAPDEGPAFFTKEPVHGKVIEVVSRSTYERVVAALQYALKEQRQ
jgi:hypothetical protein